MGVEGGFADASNALGVVFTTLCCLVVACWVAWMQLQQRQDSSGARRSRADATAPGSAAAPAVAATAQHTADQPAEDSAGPVGTAVTAEAHTAAAGSSTECCSARALAPPTQTQPRSQPPAPRYSQHPTQPPGPNASLQERQAYYSSMFHTALQHAERAHLAKASGAVPGAASSSAPTHTVHQWNHGAGHAGEQRATLSAPSLPLASSSSSSGISCSSAPLGAGGPSQRRPIQYTSLLHRAFSGGKADLHSHGGAGIEHYLRDAVSRALLCAGPRLAPDSGAHTDTSAVPGCVQLLSYLTVLPYHRRDAPAPTVTQDAVHQAAMSALETASAAAGHQHELNINFSVLAAPGIRHHPPTIPAPTPFPMLVLSTCIPEGQDTVLHVVMTRAAQRHSGLAQHGMPQTVRMVLCREGAPVVDRVCDVDWSGATAAQPVLPGVLLGPTAVAIARLPVPPQVFEPAGVAASRSSSYQLYVLCEGAPVPDRCTIGASTSQAVTPTATSQLLSACFLLLAPQSVAAELTSVSRQLLSDQLTAGPEQPSIAQAVCTAWHNHLHPFVADVCFLLTSAPELREYLVNCVRQSLVTFSVDGHRVAAMPLREAVAQRGRLRGSVDGTRIEEAWRPVEAWVSVAMGVLRFCDHAGLVALATMVQQVASDAGLQLHATEHSASVSLAGWLSLGSPSAGVPASGSGHASTRRRSSSSSGASRNRRPTRLRPARLWVSKAGATAMLLATAAVSFLCLLLFPALAVALFLVVCAGAVYQHRKEVRGFIHHRLIPMLQRQITAMNQAASYLEQKLQQLEARAPRRRGTHSPRSSGSSEWEELAPTEQQATKQQASLPGGVGDAQVGPAVAAHAMAAASPTAVGSSTVAVPGSIIPPQPNPMSQQPYRVVRCTLLSPRQPGITILAAAAQAVAQQQPPPVPARTFPDLTSTLRILSAGDAVLQPTQQQTMVQLRHLSDAPDSNPVPHHRHDPSSGHTPPRREISLVAEHEVRTEATTVGPAVTPAPVVVMPTGSVAQGQGRPVQWQSFMASFSPSASQRHSAGLHISPSNTSSSDGQGGLGFPAGAQLLSAPGSTALPLVVTPPNTGSDVQEEATVSRASSAAARGLSSVLVASAPCAQAPGFVEVVAVLLVGGSQKAPAVGTEPPGGTAPFSQLVLDLVVLGHVRSTVRKLTRGASFLATEVLLVSVHTCECQAPEFLGVTGDGTVTAAQCASVVPLLSPPASLPQQRAHGYLRPRSVAPWTATAPGPSSTDTLTMRQAAVPGGSGGSSSHEGSPPGTAINTGAAQRAKQLHKIKLRLLKGDALSSQGSAEHSLPSDTLAQHQRRANLLGSEAEQLVVHGTVSKDARRSSVSSTGISTGSWCNKVYHRDSNSTVRTWPIRAHTGSSSTERGGSEPLLVTTRVSDASSEGWHVTQHQGLGAEALVHVLPPVQPEAPMHGRARGVHQAARQSRSTDSTASQLMLPHPEDMPTFHRGSVEIPLSHVASAAGGTWMAPRSPSPGYGGMTGPPLTPRSCFATAANAFDDSSSLLLSSGCNLIGDLTIPDPTSPLPAAPSHQAVVAATEAAAAAGVSVVPPSPARVRAPPPPSPLLCEEIRVSTELRRSQELASLAAHITGGPSVDGSRTSSQSPLPTVGDRAAGQPVLPQADLYTLSHGPAPPRWSSAAEWQPAAGGPAWHPVAAAPGHAPAAHSSAAHASAAASSSHSKDPEFESWNDAPPKALRQLHSVSVSSAGSADIPTGASDAPGSAAPAPPGMPNTFLSRLQRGWRAGGTASLIAEAQSSLMQATGHGGSGDSGQPTRRRLALNTERSTSTTTAPGPTSARGSGSGSGGPKAAGAFSSTSQHSELLSEHEPSGKLVSTMPSRSVLTVPDPTAVGTGESSGTTPTAEPTPARTTPGQPVLTRTNPSSSLSSTPCGAHLSGGQVSSCCGTHVSGRRLSSHGSGSGSDQPLSSAAVPAAPTTASVGEPVAASASSPASVPIVPASSLLAPSLPAPTPRGEPSSAPALLRTVGRNLSIDPLYHNLSATGNLFQGPSSQQLEHGSTASIIRCMDLSGAFTTTQDLASGQLPAATSGTLEPMRLETLLPASHTSQVVSRISTMFSGTHAVETLHEVEGEGEEERTEEVSEEVAEAEGAQRSVSSNMGTMGSQRRDGVEEQEPPPAALHAAPVTDTSRTPAASADQQGAAPVQGAPASSTTITPSGGSATEHALNLTCVEGAEEQLHGEYLAVQCRLLVRQSLVHALTPWTVTLPGNAGVSADLSHMSGSVDGSSPTSHPAVISCVTVTDPVCIRMPWDILGHTV